MTSFFETDVICPCCKVGSEAKVLTGTNTFGGRYTDFHTRAAGMSPLPYVIYTCPYCGYTGVTDQFMEPTTISPDIAKRVFTELSPLVHRRAPEAGTRYEFAARIAEWRGDDANEIGNLYLRAAWCCVDDKDTEGELRYRQQAIAYFVRALDNSEVPLTQEPTTTYLVGELYRRVGEPDKAREYFDRVVERAKTDRTWQTFEWLARQQRDNPQDIIEKRRDDTG